MNKLKMHSPNFVDQNIEKITALFPNCITETAGEQGELKKAIDFDLLKQELSRHIVEGPQERYQLNWPGKREALLTANAPIAKTLRPCREESVNFDTTQNLFIEGDNLDALKLLQETYLGKVKMIFIDPPYNTGNDFIYDDDFAEDITHYVERSNQVDNTGNRLVANTETNGRFHSDWLTMMYSRVKLAKNLLSDDGVIFVSLDDNEAANFKKICDEIFGEANFLAQIAWEKRYTRSNNAKRFYSLKDNVLAYRKSASLDVIKEQRNEKSDSNYSNPDNDPGGPWMTSSYVNPATKAERPNLVYSILKPANGESVDHPTHAWKYGKNEHTRHIKENRLWWGIGGKAKFPRLKLYLSEQTKGLVPIDIWDYKNSGTSDEGGQELKKLFGKAIFDNPKPTKLIQKMLGIATSAHNSDIILDFFAGSGTTADAVLKQNIADNGNRKFFLVQLPEACDLTSLAYQDGFQKISDITKERIRRASKQLLSENLKVEGVNKLDSGFRVLKIDSSNMSDVHYNPNAVSQTDLFTHIENVKDDRIEEDLLFQVMLDWGVDLTLPIRQEIIEGNTVFFVADNALVACFDNSGKVTEGFVKKLADFSPLRLVFRDGGFSSDSAKINVEQVLKQLSPLTDVKSI
jgi:adenine-specific DNA-methyltransferase